MKFTLPCVTLQIMKPFFFTAMVVLSEATLASSFCRVATEVVGSVGLVRGRRRSLPRSQFLTAYR